MLTDDQKRICLDISRYLLSRYEDDPGDFIRVVTQDETWVHHFDPESKLQTNQWKHPGSSPPQKYTKVHSAGKVMASIFWGSQGVILIDYLEQVRTINCAYYTDKFKRLCQEIAKKCCEKLTGVFFSCSTTPLPTRHKLP